MPEHSVTVKEPDSKHPARRVLVKTTLPGVSSANQVDLEISKVSKSMKSRLLLQCMTMLHTNPKPKG